MSLKLIRRLTLTAALAAVISGGFPSGVLSEGNTLNAESEETAETDGGEKTKKLFLQAGALETRDGDKYLLRKRYSHVEFYINDDIKVFLKQDGKKEDIKTGSYVVVKGPKNDTAILANSVYIYDNREEYEEFIYTGREKSSEDIIRERASSLSGFIADPEDKFEKIEESKRPLLLESDFYTDEEGNPVQFFVFPDKDTYLIYSKSTDKNEMKIGDRLYLYFDKRISIRYKSYPVKIIINRAKIGY